MSEPDDDSSEVSEEESSDDVYSEEEEQEEDEEEDEHVDDVLDEKPVYSSFILFDLPLPPFILQDLSGDLLDSNFKFDLFVDRGLDRGSDLDFVRL